MVLSRRWTADEDERLKALVAQSASLVRSAAALKRKQASVRARAHKLGCPFPTVNEARKRLSGSAASTWRRY
jgi:hypothetical protein